MSYDCYICDQPTDNPVVIDGNGDKRVVCDRQECKDAFNTWNQQIVDRKTHAAPGSQPESEAKQKYRVDLDALWAGKLKPTSHSPPPRFHGATWDSLRKTTAADFTVSVARFLKGDTQFMAFIGPKSRGKTWAAYGVTYAFLLHNFGKEFHIAEVVDWADLKIVAGDCGSFHHSTAADARAAIKRLSTVGLLVIDEFCIIKPLDGQLDQIHKLLNERYKHKRQTIITTTRSPEELEEMMGGGIVDRFSGGKTGGCVVKFDGPNLRQE